MTAIRNIETRKMANGGYVSTIVIDGHDVLVYQPLDKMESDIINYGYSAPLLLVFGKGRFTEEEAAEHAERTKLALIAQENGGSVVYVNPLTEWEKEEPVCMKRSFPRPRSSRKALPTACCTMTRS
ncbi:MAG: hypothetical protein IKD84_05900 [Erysipelotrichaceae bacterium]|nr:hypothetical protein [Erysipelotrichaceae bacterium]